MTPDDEHPEPLGLDDLGAAEPESTIDTDGMGDDPEPLEEGDRG